MKAEHTTGPWIIRKSNDSNGFEIINENNMPIALVLDSPAMTGLIDGSWEAKENAKLIGGAPELLKALHDLVQYCNILPNSQCPEDLNPFGNALQILKNVTE